MKVVQKVCWGLVLCTFFMSIAVLVTAQTEEFSITPTINNGEKWRIGYYEGGEYIDYQKSLVATVEGLMESGWIEAGEIPPQEGEQTKDLWNWLATKAKSEYLEFLPDAHYSANWDKELREKTAAEIIEHLNTKQDIDLMLALGTWAGQDLANEKHHTPTMVLSVADALAAGIVKSLEDSGYEHIHARVDPFRFERQIRIFYDIIGFQTLGVAYEDSVDGRSQGAIDKIEQVSQELGFEVVQCYTKSDIPDQKIAEESVKTCFQELGEKPVNAIYVTVQNGVNSRSIPKLVKIANASHIPTFSQSGSEEVKAGILMSISKASFKYVGQFYAETLAKILNGAKPGQLDQIFEGPPKIAINLKTAEIIGYDPPVDVLGAADEIYQEIEVP